MIPKMILVVVVATNRLTRRKSRRNPERVHSKPDRSERRYAKRIIRQDPSGFWIVHQTPTIHHMRILVAEDDKRIAQFIIKGLREEGYVVDHAGDGNAALDFALADGGMLYDLIVLDVMMPGRDGFAVCRELRTRGVRTPVLMLTAMDALDDRVRGLDSGADDYLVKPFAFPELLARLRALSRRSPAAVLSNVLQVADLSLDVSTRVAKRGERAIELSAHEYALLEYMMRNAGRPMGRAQILQAVWSFDYDGASNVVDVYMGYLRRKIDAEGEPALVHTVRGVGYMLQLK
jgi:DNA-binding response OmpR family regulator